MRYVVGSADEVRRFAPLPRTVYLVKIPLELEQIQIMIDNYCAKRSFHPCCTSNSVVRSFVRFREIIDFCEGEQKAASLLLSTGGLSS